MITGTRQGGLYALQAAGKASWAGQKGGGGMKVAGWKMRKMSGWGINNSDKYMKKCKHIPMAVRNRIMGGWEINNCDRYIKIQCYKSDTFGLRTVGGRVGGCGCRV